MGTWQRLRQHAQYNGDVRVGIIGAGYVGRGLLELLDRLEGFEPALVLNRSLDRAVVAWRAAGRTANSVVEATDVRTASEAVLAHRPVVTTIPEVAIEVQGIDVLVEATGAIDFAARTMVAALRAGRSVVSINAEVDAAIGWLLHREARTNDAVYTMCDGDQPGVLMRTLEDVAHMGFEPLVAVNCKRHLDVYQTPETSAPYAARDGTTAAVTTAAGDGTKMNIENAVVANLSGMPPDRRGMHGVATTLANALVDVLASLERTGVVEFTLGGDFGAGVFVIGRGPRSAPIQQALRFFKMGDGPEYLFFAPHTLVHFAMPRSIAEVALDRTALWVPTGPPVAEVVAIAKRDLRPGDVIDGIGGYSCYGQIDTMTGAEGLLPIALSEGARVVHPVACDEPVPLEAVELDDTADIVGLRREQDELLMSAGSGTP